MSTSLIVCPFLYLSIHFTDYIHLILGVSIRLKTETRWSACFYAYLAALVAGMTGDLKQARELFLQCGKLVKRKNNNLEKFCARRVRMNGWTYV